MIDLGWLEIVAADRKRVSAYRERKTVAHTTKKKRRGPKRGGRGKVARRR